MAQVAAPGRLYTAHTLTDRNVISSSGENLGEIKDFVIDASRGCVAYAVLSYSGGFLNLNRKYFAVPWEAFRIDEAHRDLVLDVDKELLKSSPGFDDDDWPSEPDMMFAQSVSEHYGYPWRGSDRGDYERQGGTYGGDYSGGPEKR